MIPKRIFIIYSCHKLGHTNSITFWATSGNLGSWKEIQKKTTLIFFQMEDYHIFIQIKDNLKFLR